jgi:hypothetical protein
MQKPLRVSESPGAIYDLGFLSICLHLWQALNVLFWRGLLDLVSCQANLIVSEGIWMIYTRQLAACQKREKKKSGGYGCPIRRISPDAWYVSIFPCFTLWLVKFSVIHPLIVWATSQKIIKGVYARLWWNISASGYLCRCRTWQYVRCVISVPAATRRARSDKIEEFIGLNSVPWTDEDHSKILKGNLNGNPVCMDLDS